MFRRPSQRKQLIQRIVVSIIAMLFIVAGVIVTVLFILGYRLDSDSGRLEQGALLQFESVPGGAGVFVDGNYTGSQTTTKRTVI
ncbi:hypothetical protein GW746_01200, partial [Candidatus Saccharibacteria bacterium]|nr:hypothetical protein [Candidatus Saccharibacteria bacterium]